MSSFFINSISLKICNFIAAIYSSSISSITEFTCVAVPLPLWRIKEGLTFIVWEFYSTMIWLIFCSSSFSSSKSSWSCNLILLPEFLVFGVMGLVLLLFCTNLGVGLGREGAISLIIICEVFGYKELYCVSCFKSTFSWRAMTLSSWFFYSYSSLSIIVVIMLYTFALRFSFL